MASKFLLATAVIFLLFVVEKTRSTSVGVATPEVVDAMSPPAIDQSAVPVNGISVIPKTIKETGLFGRGNIAGNKVCSGVCVPVGSLGTTTCSGSGCSCGGTGGVVCS